jgi:phage recombination protein Bet
MTTQAMQKQENGIMNYQVSGQQITLSPQIVRQWLVSGDKPVTDSEVMLFMALCKANALNPFVRDAFLVKYSDKFPAAMVVSKYAYAKRAEHHPHYAGFKAGVVLRSGEGVLVYREGAIVADGEELIGGWAEVYRSDRQHPIRSEISVEEYTQMKPIWGNGQKVGEEPNEMWTKKRGTMCRKVALVQAWREAFPEEYAGIYSEEEMPTFDAPKDVRPVTDQVHDILAATKAEPQALPEPTIIDSVPEAKVEEQPAAAPAPAQVEPVKPAQEKKQQHPISAASQRFGIAHVRCVHKAAGLPENSGVMTAEQMDEAARIWAVAMAWESVPPHPRDSEWPAYIEAIKAALEQP